MTARELFKENNCRRETDRSKDRKKRMKEWWGGETGRERDRQTDGYTKRAEFKR